MTERLYYFDSYRTNFDATVVEQSLIDHRPAIALDQTYFYPTSGGQAHDRGILDGHPIHDVIIDANGIVQHLLADELTDKLIGQPVSGSIDWERRFDHMQQHSAQHLLSHVFSHLFGHETVSVHFGATESTIDLAADELTKADSERAEEYANNLVTGNLPITAYMVNDQEIAKLPLRRPPSISGQIRVVEISELDYSACGGTHVRMTAELGLIKLVRQERSRGNARITFLAGRRAVADYGVKHEIVAKSAALFSNEGALVPEMIANLLEQNKILNRQVAELTDRQLVHDAAHLMESATPLEDVRLIADILPNQSVENLKKLATLLQEHEHAAIVLGTANRGKGTLITARGAAITLHMGNILRDTLMEFGGGGGGRSDFAQGGGISGEELDKALSLATRRIRHELESL